jgi:hypothetical protein
MNFDLGSLSASFLVSGVGFVFFSYGRKMARPPQFVGGLVLLIFPYFVSNVTWMLAIGALVSMLVWLATRYGW